MIPENWRTGEVAVVGLGRTGVAVSRWLVAKGVRVYASDAAETDAVNRSAGLLAREGVAVNVGTHDLERLTKAVAVVVSPGVPPDVPSLVAARNAGVPIIAELDLAARALNNSRLVVVTGTNGKTTVTAWLAHVLKTAGRNAVAAGNIGRPLIEVTNDEPVPDWIVVEASSYQLHDAPNLKPEIGIVTNLAPDHLDRYHTIEAYYADKQLLFQNATDDSLWVLNGDDEALRELAAGVPGKRLHWSTQATADGWYDAGEEQLMLGNERLVGRAAVPLLGDHNVSNALAVALVASAMGLTLDEIADGLKTFSPLEHRLEPVREIGQVLWINDSKATNVASAFVAFSAMTNPFVALIGGLPKNEDFRRLIPAMKLCKEVVTFGKAAEIVHDALGNAVNVTRVDDLERAVKHAQGRTSPGDVVLLSPACASFDQFENFEARGLLFRELVGNLA